MSIETVETIICDRCQVKAELSRGMPHAWTQLVNHSQKIVAHFCPICTKRAISRDGYEHMWTKQ